MKKFTRLSQVPTPVAGPGAPPQIPGMPDMMGGMPTMPMAAPAEPPKRTEVTGPLDSLAKVLYDIDITSLIENSTGTDPESLAMEIWTTYGGDEKGGVKRGCQGNRQDSEEPPPEQELKSTEDKRWLRLPVGDTIADITSLDELSKIMNGLVLGTVKNTAKENSAPPGGPGGAPPALASRTKIFVRVGEILDDLKMYEKSDEITDFLRFI